MEADITVGNKHWKTKIITIEKGKIDKKVEEEK